MTAILPENVQPLPNARGSLPARMRVLYITTADRTGGWLAEALATEHAGQISLVEAHGVPAAIDRLRKDVFDALLISHDPYDLNALELVAGLRAGGAEEPMIILGAQSIEDLLPAAFEVRADGYLCVHSTTIRAMVWAIAQAIERHQLLRENRRLLQAEHQRLQYDHVEAEHLLTQQRALISDLEQLGGHADSSVQTAGLSATALAPAGDPEPHAPLPESLKSHYRELLRAYVIMGSGNLTHEMGALAQLLVASGVSAQQTMLLHLQVLEEMIRGLGSRSARHVMTRADLLALEVMVNLAEGYRQRAIN